MTGYRVALSFAAAALMAFAAEPPKFDYRVLATTRTSTMEKEINQAADAGYVFSGVMGGETEFGGNEVVVVMERNTAAPSAAKRMYRLLATTRTSTMQKELQQAGREGFDYCGQTVFKSALAGREVAVILERNPEAGRQIEYKLLATSRTSTMQKELTGAGEDGFEFLGVVVAKTAIGGHEVLSILRKYVE
jgi:hypothetical protein